MNKILIRLKIREKLLKPCLCILLTGSLWACDDYRRGRRGGKYLRESKLAFDVCRRTGSAYRQPGRQCHLHLDQRRSFGSHGQ